MSLSIPTSPLIPPPPPSPTWLREVCSLHLWLNFCFVNKLICAMFLDPTHKRHHMMFVFLWLHLTWSSLGPCVLLPMALFHSSLWLLLNIAPREPNQRIQAAVEPSLLAAVGVLKHMVAFLICRCQKNNLGLLIGGKILLEVVVVKGLRF